MATSIDGTDRHHPITAAVGRMRTQILELQDAPTWSLTDAECREALLQLSAFGAQVAELELRVAHQARVVEAGEATGAASTATWWAHTSHQTRTETHRKALLADALADHEATRSALARGDVLAAQAQVIVAAVDALPDDLDPALVRQAESTLIDEAAHHDAKALKILGRRLLDVVAPEIGEAHEAGLLEQEEKAAEAACRLTMSDDGHGRFHGRFTLPSLQGAMLRKALLAIAAPKHQTATTGKAPIPGRPSAQRMGLAFCEYVERYPADRLPDAGGVSATVVVTITQEALQGADAAATVLDTGDRVSPGQARRLACEAGLIPAVLGGGSVPLDLGRTRRLHTRPQRIALALSQRCCTAQGCDVPAGMCHVHHEIPWSRGGPTDLAHAKLLCPKHHRLAHRQPDVIQRT